MNNAISLTPRRVSLLFAAAVVILAGAHIIMQIAVALWGADVRGFANMLDVGREKNVPTFFSCFALLFSAVLAGAVGWARRDNDRKVSLCWFVLSLGFVYMAVDDFVEIHERLIKPVRSTLNTSGLLFYAWVIPYGLALIPVLIGGLWFLRRLPGRTAKLFAVAGITFVGGAMFVEMFSGWVLETLNEGVYADRGPLYIVLQTSEEILELSGVVIFIYGALDYVSRYLGGISIVLGARDVLAPASVPPTVEKRPSTPTTIGVPEAARAAEMLMEQSEEKKRALDERTRR